MFYLMFVGEHSPNQDKSAGNGFERCEATAPEGGGQDARHKLPDIKSSKKAIRKDGLFAFRTNIQLMDYLR